MKHLKPLLFFSFLGIIPLTLMPLISCNESAKNTIWKADGSNWDGVLTGTVTCTTVDNETTEGYSGVATLTGSSEVSGGQGTWFTAKNLVIPPWIEKEGKKYKLTKIGDNAFNKTDKPDKKIKGVLKFSDGLKEIGESAFENQYQLGGDVELYIPDSVTVIGPNAFRMDTISKLEFKSLKLSNSLTTLGDYAFYNSQFGGSLIIPNTLTVIEDNVFYNSKFDGSLTIPSSITSVRENAFFKCKFTSLYLQGWTTWGYSSGQHNAFANSFAEWLDTGEHKIHLPQNSTIAKNNFGTSESNSSSNLGTNPLLSYREGFITKVASLIFHLF